MDLLLISLKLKGRPIVPLKVVYRLGYSDSFDTNYSSMRQSYLKIEQYLDLGVRLHRNGECGQLKCKNWSKKFVITDLFIRFGVGKLLLQANLYLSVTPYSSLGPLLFLKHINDLHSTSEFSTRLFADNTYLNMSYTNLQSLQSRVNCELKKINNWFRWNKLSLNCQKSNCIPINKVPQKSISAPFTLTINKTLIERKQAVKYVGLCIDKNFSWSSHIKELSLQLARSSGIFYKLINSVSIDTLPTLLCALVYSRLQYGIIVWGTAHEYLLQEINLRLNRLIRIVTSSTKFCPLYKNLKLLKLADLYNFELAKFFYLLAHDELPSGVYENLTKIQQIHDHNTRRSKKIVYFVPRFSKSLGQNHILHTQRHARSCGTNSID